MVHAISLGAKNCPVRPAKWSVESRRFVDFFHINALLFYTLSPAYGEVGVAPEDLSLHSPVPLSADICFQIELNVGR